MKKIVICGYFGFDNFGDEWLLDILSKLILQVGEKNKQIFVLYNIKEKLQVNDCLYYIPRWKIKEVIKILKISDTLIFCGGVFQDQTSILSFFYYLTIFFLAKVYRSKIVILSTEFIVKKLPKKIFKFLIKNTDIIFVRNQSELEKIKDLNLNIKFCPDICFFSDIENTTNKNLNDTKTIGIIFKKDSFNKGLIVNICKMLSEKYKLVFIPFHLKEDYKFCLELVENIKNCEIRVWDKIQNYKKVFNGIDLVITSRLHGIVAALNLNIPVICCSKDEKLKNFINNFNGKVCLLEEFNNNNFDIKNKIIMVPIEQKLQYKKEILEKIQFLADNRFI